MRPQRAWFAARCCGPFLVLLLVDVAGARAQTDVEKTQKVPAFNLRVAVDEVTLTFQAVDVHGAPVRDLKVGEIVLLDNERPPGRVIAFQRLEDLPLRAGILMDRSVSMQPSLAMDQAIARR